MHRPPLRPLLLIALSAALIGGLLWYHGSGKPLAADEVNHYLARIAAQQQSPGGRHDLTALREFLEADDGKPFHTVNLYRYNAQAAYTQPTSAPITGIAAYQRFSRAMVPLLLRRGSHPVFGSTWIGTNDNKWDRLVLVRYRSRRDIADLFASDAFADASAHKWASIADHERLLVQSVNVPQLDLLTLLITGLLLLGLLPGLWVMVRGVMAIPRQLGQAKSGASG